MGHQEIMETDGNPQYGHNQCTSWSISSCSSRTMILVFFCLVFVFYLIRSITTEAPIMASDEYVYYILSRYLNQVNLFAFDPMLQHVDNRFYFALQHIWMRLDGGNGVLVTRIVHLLEWSASAALLYAAFADIAEKRSRVLAVCAMVLLPSSFYTLTMLPETDLVFMAALLGYVVIRWLHDAPLRAAATAGIISGVALLLKPHAIAWVPAMLASIGCVAYARKNEKFQFFATVWAAAAFILGWYLGFFLGWRISSGGWSFNPSIALGLQFYGGHVSNAGDAGFLGRNLAQILGYFVAHLAVLALIFGPALAGVLIACRGVIFKLHGDHGRLSVAGIFVLSMLFSHLVMISYFTASAGVKSAGEALRLHGRYLGVILVFLPFFYFKFFEKVQIRAARVYALTGLGVSAIFYFLVCRNIKIYPWDYPELFAFFASSNHYGWGFGDGVALGKFALAWCVIGFVASAVRPGWFRALMTIQLIMLLCVGNIQMQRWLNSHMQINASLINMAEVLGQSLQPENPGDGLLIGAERYGKMSYILFGLGNAPRVLIKEPGSTIKISDLQGAKWVIVSEPYNVEFPYRSLVKFGNLTLYPLATTSPAVGVAEKKNWTGDPFALEFGIGGGAWSQMQGFNLPEIWGAWTAKSVAEIELPYFIQGRVRLRIFGWVLLENVGNRVRVTLGDSIFDIKMTSSGADYQIDFHVNKPLDRIRFDIPVVRHPDSSRDMGVALRGIEISQY
jgi:hypothetical protein